MPYIYANVTTTAAPAILAHPEFDARLRPLLDQMCDAVRRGEAGAPYLPAPVAVAKDLYEGNPDQATLFVWCCIQEASAESYKAAIPTTVGKLRRGDIVVDKGGEERVVLSMRLGVDTLDRFGTTLHLRGVCESVQSWPRWNKVRRLPRVEEQNNA